jgi:hypothetical protein
LQAIRLKEDSASAGKEGKGREADDNHQRS